MSDTEVNIPLLRKAVEWAEAEAAKPYELCEWNQQAWVAPATAADREAWGVYLEPEFWDKAPECGTCYCIAGFAVAATVGPVGTTSFAIEHEATKQLGLDETQADALFCCDNTIEDVRRIAEDIAGERL